MKEKSYSCNNCKEKFGRKWNADRHNKVVHNDMAMVFNNKSGSISKHKGTAQSYNNSTNVQQEHPFYKSFKDIDINLHPVTKHEMSIEEEFKIISIFGKLKQPFEELEKLLSDKPENTKITFLSDIVTSALMSPNPVTCLQEAVDFYHSLAGKQKIMWYVSKRNNFLPAQTDAYLSGLIKNGRYYKNKIG